MKRDYAKARAILEQEAAEAAALGPEASAENSLGLAGILRDSRQYNEANEVLKAALDKLGPNPIGEKEQLWRGFLLAMQANVANASGRSDEALAAALQARTVIESVAGINVPQLFILDGIIGGIYRKQGNFAESEKAYLRALKLAESRRPVSGTVWSGMEEVFVTYLTSNSTEGILRTTTSLGDLNLDQKKFKEAEAYYVKAMKVAEQDYGKKHQAVLLPLQGLARLHAETGRHKEFENDLQRMYDLSVKAPGLDPWVLDPFWLKAGVDLAAGNNIQPTADQIAQIVSVQHFDTKLIANRSQAIANSNPGKSEQIQTAFRSAALSKFSAEPLRLAPMLLAYAQAAEAAQNSELARVNYEALAKTQEKGPEKGLYLGSLGKIADSYIAEKKPAEALPICRKITAALRDKYGDDSRVADALDREATLLKQLGRDGEATATQAASAEVRKKAYTRQ